MLSSCFLCYDQTNAVNENTAILLFACSATSATLVGIFFLCVSVCVCVKIFSTGLSMVSREVADAAVAHSESGVNVLVSVWLMIGLKKKCLTPVRKSKIIASAKCKRLVQLVHSMKRHDPCLKDWSAFTQAYCI